MTRRPRDSDTLSVEHRDDILELTLHRPERSNALNADLVACLGDALDHAANVRLCVLRGEGKNFCGGFDLSDIETSSDADLVLRFIRVEQVLQKIHHAPFPVLALANGHSVGAGADLFAACSHRIAAPDARFRMPGWGFHIGLGTGRLTRLVGPDAARELLLEASTITADKAETIGLATDIAPTSAWNEAIDRLALRVRRLRPEAVVDLLELTRSDHRDHDLSRLVSTASRPGLQQRIAAFRDT